MSCIKILRNIILLALGVMIIFTAMPLFQSSDICPNINIEALVHDIHVTITYLLGVEIFLFGTLLATCFDTGTIFN